MSPEQVGAKTLVVGIVNVGGYMAEAWIPTLTRALETGLDLAAGCTIGSQMCRCCARQPLALGGRCMMCVSQSARLVRVLEPSAADCAC
jgi:hypothetical protein